MKYAGTTPASKGVACASAVSPGLTIMSTPNGTNGALECVAVTSKNAGELAPANRLTNKNFPRCVSLLRRSEHANRRHAAQVAGPSARSMPCIHTPVRGSSSVPRALSAKKTTRRVLSSVTNPVETPSSPLAAAASASTDVSFVATRSG